MAVANDLRSQTIASVISHVLAGTAAHGVSTLMAMPQWKMFEIQFRTMASGTKIGDVFRETAQRDGAFWMWTGATQQLAATALPMGLRLACFQLLRSAFPVTQSTGTHNSSTGSSTGVNTLVILMPRTIGARSSWFPIDAVVSAVGAATAAIVIENPLLQARLHANAQQAFEFNFWPLARRLVRERGVGALFEGMSFRLWYGIPFYGILLPVYEWLVRVRMRDVSRTIPTSAPSSSATTATTSSTNATTITSTSTSTSSISEPDTADSHQEDYQDFGYADQDQDELGDSIVAPERASEASGVTSIEPATTASPTGISFTGIFFAGGLASVAATLATMPIQNAHIRMNFNKVPARRTFSYMAQLSRQQLASFNFFSRAAYTSARNFPLFGFMFAAYEGMFSWLAERTKADVSRAAA